MSKAGSKGMAGMAMAIPIFVKSDYSTGPHRLREPICTHLCAFMKICLFLQLCQLIIGGSGPDVKASIR